jgi:hypothetical protein
MGKPDALSRQADHGSGQGDNDNLTLLAPELFRIHALAQTERVNQELEGYLCIFTSRQQDDWDELLPLGEFSHNNHVHSSTQQTPFMVDTGRHPRMGFEPQQPCSKLESVNEFVERMAQGLEEAKAALTTAKDEYAMYYNRRWEPAPVFTQGDRVWLDVSDIATNRPSSKLPH